MIIRRDSDEIMEIDFANSPFQITNRWNGKTVLEDLETRITKRFLWTYISDEMTNKIEDELFSPCTWLKKEDLDTYELVS